jgi:hypothetical protein
MGTGEGGKPHEQSRVIGAEANPPFGMRDRSFRPAAVKVYLAENDIGSREAWIEFDCLLKLSNRPIGPARPHADKTKREMSVRIAGVESDRT